MEAMMASRDRRWSYRVIASLLFMLWTAACSEQPAKVAPGPALAIAAPGTALRAIQDRGKLIVGVKHDVPLFGYLDPATGVVDGFDVAIARALARQIFGDEQRLQLVEVVSKNRIPFLEDGTVDVVISTMTITAERAEQVDFSEPYYIAGQSLLVPRGSMIRGLPDLVGKRVGSVSGSTSERNLRERAPQAEVLLFDNYAAAVLAMAAQQVEAVTTDDIILHGFARHAPERWEVVGGQFTREPYGVAIRRGQPELVAVVNDVIRAMKQDGRWQALYRQWIGGEPPSPPPADWRSASGG
jgi:putative glutamine transport system substrate-binding protein